MTPDDAPRLLLVEDSDTQALVFRRTLEGFGFAVERTRTAEDALTSLNVRLPDILVVDYRLPGMNGDELVRILRQTGHTRTLPIIMLTSDAASEVERQGLDSGASAYVPKASGPDLLVSRMRSLLRQRRPHSAAAAGGFRQARLLLVEDDAGQRQLLQALLAGEGHAVEVTDGTPARLDALWLGDVDGVLVGQAPGDDPFAWLRLLDARRDESAGGLEIVALVPDAGAERTLAALDAGADDVVPRSNEHDMLLVRLRAVIRRKLARDDEASSVARERERDLALARARAEAEASEALAHANRELAGANKQLRNTQAQLVQAAKMASLGELVAGIAHEINNPLAFILAHQATVERAVQAAREAEDADSRQARLEKASDRLASMRSGLLRIQDLVVKLRRFSRLDDGEWSTLDVPEAIDAVLTLLHPKTPAGVVIERSYDPRRTLECSSALVNQVVMNIVSNALDAIAADTGRIAVSTEVQGDRFVITVADNGPGIAADVRERVFEPFFTTKDVGSGTGLGLAIAYGVVRAHKGTIAIDEGELGGARFTIAVPMRRP